MNRSESIIDKASGGGIAPETKEALAEAIKAQYLAIFKLGRANFVVSNLGTPSIIMKLGLVGDKSDLPNGIAENDPYIQLFSIYPDPKGFLVERFSGAGLKVEPPEGSHLYSATAKVPFRKSRGDTKSILRSTDRYFKRMQHVIKDNKDSVLPKAIPAKYLNV